MLLLCAVDAYESYAAVLAFAAASALVAVLSLGVIYSARIREAAVKDSSLVAESRLFFAFLAIMFLFGAIAELARYNVDAANTPNYSLKRTAAD